MSGTLQRDWTDEIFTLFLEGRLGRLSARDVCRAIDWISSQPMLLASIEGLSSDDRRRRLAVLVDADPSSGSRRFHDRS